MVKITRRMALKFHSGGKIGLNLLKELNDERDLSLAYTPGVAEPCLAIKSDIEDVYTYTAKSNLVAVVTDGTAVLGLGDIGPSASIPVMEGKAVLFKAFAGIDGWPVPLDGVRTEGKTGRTDVDRFVEATKTIAPMYGGINIEDVAAPECFEVEKRLVRELDIPVFHDDQHGTAIISLAALKNYLLIVGKNISSIRVVVCGAGAAGIRIAELYKKAGIEELILCDSQGIVYEGRIGINRYKEPFAVKTKARSVADALKGADVFVGVSSGEILSVDAVKAMAPKPAVFAMANPIPEIRPEAALAARSDLIMATGRSDYPNQINNVLGFPFIFRGALDVVASDINDAMKLACADALAERARQEVPEHVKKAYPGTKIEFGPDYIIPKPFDRNVFVEASRAVAKAAMSTGVAKKSLNIPAYSRRLKKMIGKTD